MNNLKTLNEGFLRRYLTEADEAESNEIEVGDLFLNGDETFKLLDVCIDENGEVVVEAENQESGEPEEIEYISRDEAEELYNSDELSESINFLVESLNEAAVDPQTINDTKVLKSIQAKINGKQLNPKKLTTEERAVLDKYGLDAWGYKGDDVIATKGLNNILNADPYSSKEAQAQKSGKVNLADRAAKIDNRAGASKDIKNIYGRDTFQQKNNTYINKNMSKNVQDIKSALKDRRDARNDLNGGIDKFYKDRVDKINAKYDKEADEVKKDKVAYQKYAREKTTQINDLLAKHRQKLSKRIEECLSRLNETQMSDEDKHDTTLLNNIQYKLNSRSNAKLTPEEDAVLDKYDLKRVGSSLYSKSNSRLLKTSPSYPTTRVVNTADRARKIGTRDYNNSDIYSDIESERRHVNNQISKDTNEVKDLLSDRRRYQNRVDRANKNLDDIESQRAFNLHYAEKNRQDLLNNAQDILDKSQTKIDYILKNKKQRESLKEATKLFDNVRTISTGLDSVLSSSKATELLQSIIGQMSDGMWENTSGMEKYWRFADVNGTNLSIDDGYIIGDRKSINSGYAGKSDSEVKKFFANKLKAICQQYLHDKNLNPYKNWNEDCEEVCSYLGYKEDITIGDAYKAFRVLSGR